MKPLTLEETAKSIEGWIKGSKTLDQLQLMEDVIDRFIVHRFVIDPAVVQTSVDLKHLIYTRKISLGYIHS